MSEPLRERCRCPLRRRVWIIEQALQSVPQVMQRECFSDELGHHQRSNLLPCLRGPGSRQNDHRLCGMEMADLVQDREPVHSRHVQIKHQDVGRARRKSVRPF